MSPKQKLIALAGGPKRIAVALDISTAAASKWVEVPAERVIRCCEVVNWAITPHELRPDIYPNSTDGLPADATPSPNPSPRPTSGPGAKSGGILGDLEGGFPTAPDRAAA